MAFLELWVACCALCLVSCSAELTIKSGARNPPVTNLARESPPASPIVLLPIETAASLAITATPSKRQTSLLGLAGKLPAPLVSTPVKKVSMLELRTPPAGGRSLDDLKHMIAITTSFTTTTTTTTTTSTGETTTTHTPATTIKPTTTLLFPEAAAEGRSLDDLNRLVEIASATTTLEFPAEGRSLDQLNHMIANTGNSITSSTTTTTTSTATTEKPIPPEDINEYTKMSEKIDMLLHPDGTFPDPLCGQRLPSWVCIPMKGLKNYWKRVFHKEELPMNTKEQQAFNHAKVVIDEYLHEKNAGNYGWKLR